MSGVKFDNYCTSRMSCSIIKVEISTTGREMRSKFIKTSVSVRLALALINEDRDKVGELLRDFDPNSLIRNKPVISFVKSREMLDFLVDRGLDLSLNRPLVNCKCEVFKDLVSSRFKIDIFSDYRDVRGWKKKELTELLVKRRGSMFFILSGTILVSDMRAFLVDLVYPCPEPMSL